MSIQRQHSTARRAVRRGMLGLAAAILICAGLGGCTAVQPPTAAPTAPERGRRSRCRTRDAELDAGTYLVDAFTVPFEVTVPDGWRSVSDAVLIDKTLDEPRRPSSDF